MDETTETTSGSNKWFHYGASAMQGHRPTMEDAHLCHLSLEGLPGHALFMVLDGHGGADAAAFAREEFLRVLQDTAEWQAYSQLYIRRQKKRQQDKTITNLLEHALIRTFVELDRELYLETTSTASRRSYAGCTAVAALVTPNMIVCANLGDSRCILATSSVSAPSSVQTQPLSRDHTAVVEQNRIVAAGGSVCDQGRVNGELAVSRAFGDFEFKQMGDYHRDNPYDPNDDDSVEQLILHAQQHVVMAVPEIQIHDRNNSTDRFLVLACDGIWDVATNDQVADWVVNALQQQAGDVNVGLVCEHVLDICLQRESQDNMTVVVVLLGEAGAKLKK